MVEFDDKLDIQMKDEIIDESENQMDDVRFWMKLMMKNDDDC